MKRHPYLDLWIILATSLLVFLGVALYDEDITLGSYTVKKAPFRQTLLSGDNSADSQPLLPTEEAQEEEVEIDESPQTFLIFGDSMTPNLARRLADYAGANGHTAVHSVNWDSSNCITWAESDRLEHFIAKYRPTYIIVCLGSNESFLRNPSDRRELVKRIISKFNNLPFIWIGPPKFGEQDAYNNLFQEMLPKHYFRSDGLELDRGPDNIHPIQSGSNKWMDAVMEWLPSSSHPFRARKPGPDTRRATLTFDSFGPPKAQKPDTIPADSLGISESSEFSEPSEISDNPPSAQPDSI